jgi:DeoR/GlpR family transcriptional regulator of sugar metabolism
MKPEDRRHEIIELLVSEREASLERLAERFAVSKMTIHRDLDELEADGLLRKIRGGATIESSGRFEADFRFRARSAAEEKRRIASRAAEFIEPGMSVMVDDGSTSQMLAPYLAEKRPLSVITNNLALISELAGAGGIEVIALGGTYSRKFNGFFGILTEAALRGLRADMAFLSSSSIIGRQAYHQDQEVLEVKLAMIEAAAKTYLVVDHRKFGRTALHLMCGLDAFEGVVTSSALAPEIAEGLRADGVKLYFAEDGADG